MLQQGLRGCRPLAPQQPSSAYVMPALPQQRSRCCQVVQVSDAQTAEVELAPGITWGRSMVQGPRPSMEDELRLEVDCKDGFTFAGDPAWLSTVDVLISLCTVP